MSEGLDPDAEMAAERLGQVVAGHRLEKLIGVGGMAAVYEALSKKGERVAVKVLHPEMCRRPEIRKRFAQEATAAGLVQHSGVVRIKGAGEEGDAAFIVMELLEGEPLGTLLRRDGPLPVPRLLDVLDQVLDALAAAHEKGVIHRDLKPDNLFVCSDGAVKVLDFGVARVAEDVPGAYKTRTGVTLGTVPFMSPEQALGKRAQVDQRSDLFSLGAMAFRMLARRNIHPAETDAELLVAMASKPAPPLESVAPDVPPGLCSIVDVALAFSKESRYPDAKTMQADVRALKEGKPPPYATKLRRSREMATRTDLPAPAALLAAVEAASAASEEEEAPPSSQWPVLSMPTLDPSDVAKTIPLPARDFPPEKPATPKPAVAAPHIADKTMVSTPAEPRHASKPAEKTSSPGASAQTASPPKGSRAPLFVFAVVLVLAGGGVVYYLSNATPPPAPPTTTP
ncbi:MAG TPA: serine/threonine-protein kinase [Polyangiaceae bacterium]|nr:serine/threonine-protein kinase [Polyangiaceae bacterium]